MTLGFWSSSSSFSFPVHLLHLPTSSLLNSSPFPGTTCTYTAVLRGFCPVEVLPFLFSGKVLPTVLHVPSQVAPIMVFLAPQMKLILCTENFFDVDHFKKSLLNLLQYCLYLMFCGFFFWHWVTWNLISLTRDWTRRPLHCKAKSHTGLPEKSLNFHYGPRAYVNYNYSFIGGALLDHVCFLGRPKLNWIALSCIKLNEKSEIGKYLVKWKSLSHVQLFVNPWTRHSMEFSRPEYWRG